MIWLVLLVLAGVVAWLLMQPRQFTVERSAVLPAPPPRVYTWLTDFSQWPQWSPWLLHDAQTTLTQGGSAGQEGATYAWASDKIGQGRITHKRLVPDQRIEQDLEFLKPFKSRADVSFDLAAAEGGQTRITWRMVSSLPLPMRPLQAMFQRMIGLDYELGLARMAGALEPAAPHPEIRFADVAERAAQRVLTRGYSGPLSGLPIFFRGSMPALHAQAAAHGKGSALGVYHRIDAKAETTVCDAAMPVDDQMVGDQIKTVPQGRYFVTHLQGDYRFLRVAWHAASGQMRMRKLKFDSSRPSLEVYVNDAAQLSDTNQWHTELHLPVRG
jgi:uncharacterized protein YndB with AHSA1/START domain/DNA gyrase inhibitor GyrI